MAAALDRRALIGLRILAQGLLPEHRLGCDDGPAGVTDVVRAFGGHQGQDLPGVIASLALRTGGRIDPVLDAFTAGNIVRGYPMRGTVFAVAARDLRWMTQLCAGPAIRAATARRPGLGLDEADVETARAALVDVTAGRSEPGRGGGVPRGELFEAWNAAGIDTTGGRGYHLLVHLISTGTAAYGPWTGTDTAVVDAATWLPAGSGLDERFNGDRTAATAELLLRYLQSHGPATLRDFAWWTKLPLTTIRSALPLIDDRLETVTIPGTDEPAYLRPGLLDAYAGAERAAMRELLLPGFDELMLGYPDRLALMEPHAHDALVPGNNGVFKRSAIRRGQVVGLWTRKGPAGRRTLVLDPVAPISPAQEKRFAKLFAAFPYTAP